MIFIVGCIGLGLNVISALFLHGKYTTAKPDSRAKYDQNMVMTMAPRLQLKHPYPRSVRMERTLFRRCVVKPVVRCTDVLTLLSTTIINMQSRSLMSRFPLTATTMPTATSMIIVTVIAMDTITHMGTTTAT